MQSPTQRAGTVEQTEREREREGEREGHLLVHSIVRQGVTQLKQSSILWPNEPCWALAAGRMSDIFALL